MTEQEIFDKAVNHLRAQGVKSIYPQTGTCRYRAVEASHAGRILMCAVGPFIPDTEYHPTMEGKGVRMLLDQHPAIREAILGEYTPARNTDPRVLLLAELQDAHDSHAEAAWEDRFRLIAQHFGLIYTPEASCDSPS